MILRKLAIEGRDCTLMSRDVSRGFFYARAFWPVYVKLPEEYMQEGDEHRCGAFPMSMYGARGAAVNWHHEYVAAPRAVA